MAYLSCVIARVAIYCALRISRIGCTLKIVTIAVTLNPSIFTISILFLNLGKQKSQVTKYLAFVLLLNYSKCSPLGITTSTKSSSYPKTKLKNLISKIYFKKLLIWNYSKYQKFKNNT